MNNRRVRGVKGSRVQGIFPLEPLTPGPLEPSFRIEGEILRLLKKNPDSYLSGQGLSSVLGISRTAVWKHIKNLMGLGYEIKASPARGYRLIQTFPPYNPLEITSGLKTSFIGKVLSYFHKIGSTNDRAYEMALKGAPEGSVVVADSQERGKGRIGRRWESPPGVNIYTSIILRPNIPPSSAPHLTLLGAVAVAETITQFLPKGVYHHLLVKWPNDILIDSKKVSGILTEMDSEMDRVNFIILGIGVNVNMTKEMLIEGLKPLATSLKEVTGREVSRVDFIHALYLNLERWYKRYLKEGFRPVKMTWQRFSGIEGRFIKVEGMGRVVEGIAIGIDENGALLVRERRRGKVVRVLAGDVTCY